MYSVEERQYAEAECACKSSSYGVFFPHTFKMAKKKDTIDTWPVFPVPHKISHQTQNVLVALSGTVPEADAGTQQPAAQVVAATFSY